MFSNRLPGALGAGLTAIGIAVSVAPAEAATFTVNNAGDAGGGTLRSAINAAELTERPDTILFEIPGNGVHTITLASDLPVFSHPVTIRGYSQPGATAPTDTAAGEPTVVIDAVNVARAIDIGGDEMEIRGLVIKNASETGIYVEGRANMIAGNHIGTNAEGTAARPNAVGVRVIGQDNVIGGPDPEDRNVISSNSSRQVDVTDGSGHVVEGNRIGTNAGGTAGLGGFVGVSLVSSGNTVRDNLIADQWAGVSVSGDDSTLQGNFVGTKKSGNAPLPNGFGVLEAASTSTAGARTASATCGTTPR